MRRAPTLPAMMIALLALPSVGQTQQLFPAPGEAPAVILSPEAPFDLAQIAPNRAVAVRNATAGGVAEIAPDVIGGIEASDLQRGATSVTDTVTPIYQRQAQISGKLGVRVGNGGLLFGRVGYAEFDLGEAFPRFASRAFSTGGVLVGAGAEVPLSRSVSLKTEIHAVDYARDLADRQLLSGLAWHY